MPHCQHVGIDPLQITGPEARLLASLARNRTEREAGAEVGLSYEGARSATARLRMKVGVPTNRDLGQWWRDYRAVWALAMAKAAEVRIA